MAIGRSRRQHRHWTVTPRRIARVRQRAGEGDAGVSPATTMGGRLREVPAAYASLLREPADRDARGYILSAAQRDFPTAIKFANTLMKTGVTVHRATAAFTVNERSYPAGSLVVKTAQAFRPHVLDMFEPQDHPHDVAYPGGPPIPPYDSAGWTLAYQMGLEFDRVLDAFDGPFERLTTFIEPKAAVPALANPPFAAGTAAETTPPAPSTGCSPRGPGEPLPPARQRRRHVVRRGRRGRAGGRRAASELGVP